MPEATPESIPVDLDAWDAWTPHEAASHLAGLRASWYVAAGWALDLFLGRQTRKHDDLEIGVPAHRFAEVREALDAFELVVVGDGKAWPTTESTLTRYRQTWVRERPGSPWRLDVFREPWDDDVWVLARDPRIRLSAASLIARTADGIPYARPDVVLLMKANAARPKDEVDFATTLPHLESGQRAWLRETLALVHPGHRWLEKLAAD